MTLIAFFRAERGEAIMPDLSGWAQTCHHTILAVKNVDTFCFLPVSTSSGMCCRGVLHRWLLTHHKTAFPEILQVGGGGCRNASRIWKKSRKVYGHPSLWSIVSWHAVLTFTYIICHHFTIKKIRFMTSLNATALKNLVAFFSLSPPSRRSLFSFSHHQSCSAGLVFNSGEGQSR